MPKSIRIVILVLAFTCFVGFVTMAHSALVSVSAKASGGFGAHGNPGSTAFVFGHTFTRSGEMILISASGTIRLSLSYWSGPEGITAPAGTGFAYTTSYTPIEESLVESGTLILPRPVGDPIEDIGALIGVFIPASVAGDPTFSPYDEDLVTLGIPSTDLFLIGLGSTFTAPGPGSLYLGINEWFAANNSGAFQVTIDPVPCPPVGHLDYCSSACGPCGPGEGDCDNDSECKSGLTCKQVTGTDTCQKPTECQYPVGHLDYCQECGPCLEGVGDCDNDSECLGDLICDQVTGTDYCRQPSTCPPLGDLDYCRNCGPCAEGEGDCDNDSECETGLTCVQVPGVDICLHNGGPIVGDLDFCLISGPCAAGEGDCDSDSECQSGLSCVQVPGTDVCCSHPLGHLDYCRDCGPCAAGQGDCDNDGECQSGLTCEQVIGTDTCR